MPPNDLDPLNGGQWIGRALDIGSSAMPRNDLCVRLNCTSRFQRSVHKNFNYLQPHNRSSNDEVVIKDELATCAEVVCLSPKVS